MKYVWWWITIHTLWLILITISLHIKANAQTLSWQKPEPRKNEQGVVISSEPTGYRILYEIQREHNKCLQYVGIRPKYSLDLGNVMKYDLQEDINFQKGMTYYIAIVSYTIQPILENEKEVGYRVIESPATSHACVVIRGIPEGVEFEGVYNEEYINNYTEENENEEIIIASTSVPSADGDGGDGTDNVESRRQRRIGGSTDDTTDKLYPILGRPGPGTRSNSIDRPTTASEYFDRRDNGRKHLADVDVKTGMAERDDLLLPNDRNDNKRSGRGNGVGEKFTASVQENSTQSEKPNKSNSSIKYSAISLATLLVVGLMIAKVRS